MARISINHRFLRCYSEKIDFSGESEFNLSDTVFEFLSEDYQGSSSVSSNGEIEEEEDERDNASSGCENGGSIVEEDTFWETQHQILQSVICRTSSVETKIRSITKETIKEAQLSGNLCVCGTTLDGGCRKCSMAEVCRRLQTAGFDSAICKSKWKSSSDIPSGEHTFLDVIDNSNTKRGEVRIIVELNFRGEFEMARGNDEYNKLVKRLPEIFVGKIERLLALLKILCGAAKKCMEEKKMHMGPWRKHSYMQAKWLRTCERHSTGSSPLSLAYPGPVSGPRISNHDFDLIGNISNLHRPIVAAV